MPAVWVMESNSKDFDIFLGLPLSVKGTVGMPSTRPLTFLCDAFCAVCPSDVRIQNRRSCTSTLTRANRAIQQNENSSSAKLETSEHYDTTANSAISLFFRTTQYNLTRDISQPKFLKHEVLYRSRFCAHGLVGHGLRSKLLQSEHNSIER